VAHPREDFKFIRQRLAQQCGISDPSSISLEFDGDELEDGQCPDDADMEPRGDENDFNQVDMRVG